MKAKLDIELKTFIMYISALKALLLGITIYFSRAA